jgi:hypothetical protein
MNEHRRAASTSFELNRRSDDFMTLKDFVDWRLRMLELRRKNNDAAEDEGS